MRHAACYIQDMAEILQQVRFAFRFIRRNPAFAAITVCVLALGIGANSAMFSVVNAVLIRPIPYPDPDRVGIIWEKSESQGWARINPSGPRLPRLESAEPLVRRHGADRTRQRNPDRLRRASADSGDARQHQLSPLIGVKPLLGRDFTPNEGMQDRVLILGYSAWQRISGGDPSIIGRRVIADNLPYTVIGVLSSNVWTPVPSEVYAPWNEKDLRNQDRMSHRMAVLGRLKAGVSWKQATAELETIQTQIGDDVPTNEGLDRVRGSSSNLAVLEHTARSAAAARCRRTGFADRLHEPGESAPRSRGRPRQGGCDQDRARSVAPDTHPPVSDRGRRARHSRRSARPDSRAMGGWRARPRSAGHHSSARIRTRILPVLSC